MTKQWFDSLLRTMLEHGDDAPDFLFFAGKFPLAQNFGALQEFEIEGHPGPLTEPEIQQIADLIMDGNKRLHEDFASRGSCDCSYGLAGRARFRVNIFKQRGQHSIVMRRLPADIPTIESLGLPDVFREMVREKNGLVFITGATGSGKTTTLAALLNELNSTQEVHVVTLEDPIEYVHPHKRSVFSQRELGKDFSSFAEGLRAALRQAPRVILVGEIRDRETMEIALSASETGHVVFATLHTNDAPQTINRVLGMFSREEEPQIRQRLAGVVRYIVGQRLVNRMDGGRLLVTEILGSSLRTREALLYGEAETRMFNDIVEAGSTRGWHSFDQELLRAFEERVITEDCAMIFATNKNRVRRDVDLIKKKQGDSALTNKSSGLKLQSSPIGGSPLDAAPTLEPAAAPAASKPRVFYPRSAQAAPPQT